LEFYEGLVDEEKGRVDIEGNTGGGKKINRERGKTISALPCTLGLRANNVEGLEKKQRRGRGDAQ